MDDIVETTNRFYLFDYMLDKVELPLSETLIIEDSFKAFYYRGLSRYDEDRGFLEDTCLAMQDNYKEVIKKF